MPCKGRVGCGKIAQWPGFLKYGHNLIDPENIVMRRVNLIDPETIVMRRVNFLSCIFFFRVFLDACSKSRPTQTITEGFHYDPSTQTTSSVTRAIASMTILVSTCQNG